MLAQNNTVCNFPELKSHFSGLTSHLCENFMKHSGCFPATCKLLCKTFQILYWIVQKVTPKFTRKQTGKPRKKNTSKFCSMKEEAPLNKKMLLSLRHFLNKNPPLCKTSNLFNIALILLESSRKKTQIIILFCPPHMFTTTKTLFLYFIIKQIQMYNKCQQN